jgi:hypothetical protein
MKESVHSVVLIGKTFKLPIVKSCGYNTNYIVIFISVLCIYRPKMHSIKIMIKIKHRNVLRYKDLVCTRDISMLSVDWLWLYFGWIIFPENGGCLSLNSTYSYLLKITHFLERIEIICSFRYKV